MNSFPSQRMLYCDELDTFSILPTPINIFIAHDMEDDDTVTIVENIIKNMPDHICVCDTSNILNRNLTDNILTHIKSCDLVIFLMEPTVRNEQININNNVLIEFGMTIALDIPMMIYIKGYDSAFDTHRPSMINGIQVERYYTYEDIVDFITHKHINAWELKSSTTYSKASDNLKAELEKEPIGDILDEIITRNLKFHHSDDIVKLYIGNYLIDLCSEDGYNYDFIDKSISVMRDMYTSNVTNILCNMFHTFICNCLHQLFRKNKTRYLNEKLVMCRRMLRRFIVDLQRDNNYHFKHRHIIKCNEQFLEPVILNKPSYYYEDGSSDDGYESNKSNDSIPDFIPFVNECDAHHTKITK
jgi:hypothetical protein